MTADEKRELEVLISAIERDCPAPRAKLPAAPPEMPEEPEPFGAWLLAQQDRGDWIDHLAHAARADRLFPKAGTPDDVRDRLKVMGADGDAFEQLDDAERMWLSA